jgi:hypothetical protein
MEDVAARLNSRIQLTSDGHTAYVEAVEGAFGMEIDYAQLVKQHGPAPYSPGRYSPAVCKGANRTRIQGDPDMSHASASYVERQTLPCSGLAARDGVGKTLSELPPSIRPSAQLWCA